MSQTGRAVEQLVEIAEDLAYNAWGLHPAQIVRIAEKIKDIAENEIGYD